MTSKDNNLLSTLIWTIPDNPFVQAKVDSCLKRINWNDICDRASRANNGLHCEALEKYTVGGTSLARLLKFEDGTYWVARIQLSQSTPESSRKLLSEIDTMILLRNHHVPVPQIFAYNLPYTETSTSVTSTSTAFVLLEFLPGNTAFHEARKYPRVDWGLIPCQYRQTFYRSMAAAHVCMLVYSYSISYNILTLIYI